MRKIGFQTMKTEPSGSSEEDDDDFKNGRLTKRTFYCQDLFHKSSFIKSTIRKINPHDSEDMRRVTLIDKSSEVLKYMVGDPLDNKQLLEFVTDTKEKTLYAIVGSDRVSPQERNKIQGWIMVYSGREVTLRAVRALGERVLKNQYSVLEVSYAKYPNALPGQMAHGLRQVLLEIARKDGVDLVKVNSGDQRLITAYIDPDNVKSRHMAEAAGFVLQKKKVLWDPKEFKKRDLVYLLDWQKLRQKFLSLLGEKLI